MESARVTEHRQEITNRLSMQEAKRKLKLIRKLNKNDDLREHFIDQIQYFTDYKMDPEKAIKDKHNLHRPSNQPILTSIFDKTYLNQYVEEISGAICDSPYGCEFRLG